MPPVISVFRTSFLPDQSAWRRGGRDRKFRMAGVLSGNENDAASQVGGISSPTNEKADLHVEAEER